MNLVQPKTRLEGEFEIEVRNSAGELKYSTGPVKNIIVNNFFDSWLGNSIPSHSFFNFLRFGSSNQPAVATDTDLIAPFNSTKYFRTNPEASFEMPTINTYKIGRVWALPVNAYIGTLREVALYLDNSSSLATCRAVLSPEIVAVSGDIITVKHFVTATVTPATNSGSFVADVGDGPVTYNYNITWANIQQNSTGTANRWGINGTELFASTLSRFTNNAYGCNQVDAYGSNVLVPQNVGTLPSAALGQDTQVLYALTPLPYTPGTFYRDIEYTIPVSKANIAGGVGLLWFYSNNNPAGYQRMQMNFTPRLPKDNRMEIKFTLRFPFGR